MLRGSSVGIDFAIGQQRRIRKREARGIHGIIFYELAEKMAYYPTRKDEEATNPDGSNLR